MDLRSWAVSSGLAPLYSDPVKAERLKDTARWEIEHGLSLSAADVHQASVTRSAWFRTASELFQPPHPPLRPYHNEAAFQSSLLEDAPATSTAIFAKRTPVTTTYSSRANKEVSTRSHRLIIV